MQGMRPYTDQEIKKMLKYGFDGKYWKRDRAIFATGISTGGRISEILALRVNHIIIKGQVTDSITYKRETVKGKVASRTQKVFTFAQNAINLWLEEYMNFSWFAYDNALFPSALTKKSLDSTTFSRILQKAHRKCGIISNVSTHSMRKTYADKVYESAVEKFREGLTVIEPMRSVQNSLGHINIESTMKYLSFKAHEIPDESFDFDI